MPIETGDGYVECDLTGFPMTLISRETFNFLEEPYFRPYEAIGKNMEFRCRFFCKISGKGY